MGFGSLILAVLGLSLIAFYASRVKALSMAKPLGGIQQLASLPFFYGMRAAIWCALPALALLIIWSLFDNHIISTIVLSNLPDSVKPTNTDQHNLLINSIENISSGSLDPQLADPNLGVCFKNTRSAK
jgi:phosphate transport system permease protein